MSITANNFYRIMGPKRADLSGLPYGFLFIWRPRPDGKQWFEPVPCAFSFGAYWYPWWRASWRASWRESIPRLTVSIGQPA